MDLKDLFVSHKQVQAPVVQIEKPVLPQPLYLNLKRAQKASEPSKPSISGEQPVDMSTWVVGGSRNGDYNWVVETAPKAATSPSTELTDASNDSTDTTLSQVENTSSSSGNIVADGNQVLSWTNPYESNTDQWVSDMIAAYQKQGISTNGIKNLMAKNILESNWGTSAQGSFNFGNITTGSQWKGKYFKGKDRDRNGNKITNNFRCYNSIDEYVKDEIQFLTKLYGFDDSDDIDTFLRKLQGGFKQGRRYADSDDYADKVKSRYKEITWNG